MLCVCVCVCVCTLSCVQLFMTPWIVAHQVPLSMGYSRQEYWSGLPFPSLGDLSNPGIKPVSLCLLHWQVGPLSSAPPRVELLTSKYWCPWLTSNSSFAQA